MESPTWIAFFIAACLIAISPGSGAVLSMSHGLSYGVKRASATIWGLELALIAVLYIAGAGVGSLLVASEPAFNAMKIVGAMYLIYLGWSQWRSPVAATGQAGDAEIAPVRMPSWRRRFSIGFLTNATNPKGIVFMVAVLPQFIDHSRPLALQLSVMALTMVTVDLAVMHGYAFAASRLQRYFRERRFQVVQNRVFGGVLMAVGAGLFFFKRTQQ